MLFARPPRLEGGMVARMYRTDPRSCGGPHVIHEIAAGQLRRFIAARRSARWQVAQWI